MANYELYRDDVETLETDEAETYAKIIEVMTEGMHKARSVDRGLLLASADALRRVHR